MTLSKFIKNLSEDELEAIRYGLNFLCNAGKARTSLDWVYTEDLPTIPVKNARHALAMVMNTTYAIREEQKDFARAAWPKLSNY